MKRIWRLAFPILLIAVSVLITQMLGAETLKAWAPVGIGLIVMAMWAHFETRCDNISLDMEMVEEALQRIDPENEYTNFRFRFPRKK